MDVVYYYDEKVWERIELIGVPHLGIVEDAYYMGGEYKVDQAVGEARLLPFCLDDIIKAGIEKLAGEIIPLQTVDAVEKKIRDRLKDGNGFSFIRMGDGELVTLAHDILVSTEQLKAFPHFDFLQYAGVHIPDPESRDQLLQCVADADLIGIPVVRFPSYQTMFIKLAQHHGWPLKQMALTGSSVNYFLSRTTLYDHILKNCRVLLIGNRMAEGKNFFEALGYNQIAGVIPVNGIKDVPNALAEAAKYEFDAAFVSAGISANPICTALAKQKKTALDFGHLMDELLKGTYTLRRE
ncbi:hypothetical protein LRR81_07445 [Metabacillus sp. GX 13764]|uniref:GT-D fold domain-containing protein n=1 Tax=Metabacillus kandeliae TaxID=2900151 RepID=UPI001E2AC665|nr:GT-D fold domain-containing glycosyltransferase [Metabacillus kandeliae]MCD7034069.1 hypothetical protein [Metabacillus kandeliae]